MEMKVLRVFQRQVTDQTRLALAGLPLIEQGEQESNHDALWMGVQVLIVGAGNVAKALWGAGGKRADERSPLRKSLEVDDDSALQDVALRNHFEHYDERIDLWWNTSNSRNHLDRLIGSPHSVAGIEDTDRFRVYDPATKTVYFWGDKFPLPQIADELARLLPIAEHQAGLPSWK